MTRSLVLSSSLVALMMAAGSNAEANWLQNGVPVVAIPNAQTTPSAVPDGAGGEIVVWADYRGGAESDIYAQRIDAGGNTLWPAGGVPVCTAPGDDVLPMIASDGAGGVIIVWQDDRAPVSTGTDVYAQRLNGDGQTLWLDNGVPICTAALAQTQPQIYTTGAVSLIAWEDTRNVNSDIYVQRVDENGIPLWTTNGVAVCTAAGDQTAPRVTTDDAGGAIVAWDDYRAGDLDVYVGAVNFFGTPQWTFNGVPLATGTGTTQRGARLVPDGAGGVIVVWEGNPSTNFNIYAQRLDYAGNTLWGLTDKQVCTAADDQQRVSLVGDGAGGAIVAWDDRRSGDHTDIYAQRLSPLGAGLWVDNGVPVGATVGSSVSPVIAQDGAGGAVVTWNSLIEGNSQTTDVYAQRVDAYGQTHWTAGGAPVCTAPSIQYFPTLAVQGGAAYVVWYDFRNAQTADADIYTQRVELTYGAWGRPEPAITSVVDNPGDQGGVVTLDWTASERDAYPLQEITHYSIWRAVDAVTAQHAMQRTGARADAVGLADVGRDFEGPAYRVEHTAAGSYYWEFVDTQDALAAAGYSALVPTRQDSTAADPALHYFQVVAHTSDPQIFYASAPDSASSVDNLAPATPLALVAMRAGGTAVDLAWTPGGTPEPDFAEYRIYRSATAGFITDPAHFLMSAPATTATDPAADPGSNWYYKVVAVDVHGNRSGDSNEAPVQGVTAVGDAVQTVSTFELLPSTPNPFRSATELRFALPQGGAVTLEVYDVAGHRVVSRELASMAAGWHRYAFDGRDDTGALLPTGMYFYRVAPFGMPVTAATTRKMIIER